MTKMNWISVVYLEKNKLQYIKMFYSLELIKEETKIYDKAYGVGNWVVMPSAKMPTDLDFYTISDGIIRQKTI